MVGLLDELVEECLHLLGNLHELVTGEEFQVDQHLVVARAPRVYLLAHVAQLTGEQHLHLRVNVLDVVFDDELTTVGQLVDALQLLKERGQLVLANQSYRLEHGDMGHRP